MMFKDGMHAMGVGETNSACDSLRLPPIESKAPHPRAY